MKAHKEAIAELACRHGLEIDSSATVSDLSVGQEQRVEILKLLYRRAQILILDEPTAVLSPPETETLFSTLRSLRSAGKTILFITHKLDEVLSVSDRVSVMKKGELVGTMDTETVTKEALARMMVGRNVLLKVSNPPQEKGKPVLVIDRLSCTTPKGETRLRRLSLTVHEGEVYGIAGVEGNGQSELLAILWGLYDRHVRIEGEVTVCGQSMLGLFPSEIAAAGVSFVPEDRLKTAVITGFDIGENLILGRHRERQFHHGPGFDLTRISSYTRETIDRFDIRCDLSSNPPLASLSGGNQQKIVLARELDRPDMKLLVLAQPTRGVDIGAIELIHRKIIDGRLKGLAVLLVSSELEEVISMSTRIGCLFKGSIRHEFSDEEIREGRAREADFEKKIGLHIT
jgi:simple sugar transport system ATP-binding protein